MYTTVNWIDNTLKHTKNTFISKDRVTKVGPIDEILVDFIEDNSYEMWDIQDNEGEHDYPVYNSHNFPCIYLSVDHTQEIVHFDDF